MTRVEELAAFAAHPSFEMLSDEARRALKVHLLDTIGCAIGALGAGPMRRVRAQVAELNGAGRCTLAGGGCVAPDRAALFNGALVRYLDFNDSYLARGETCHPSDNFGAILAAVEHRGASGRDLMTALALAYQVQCRMSDEAPVRSHGFDHTVQGAYAVAAGVSRALALDASTTANAVAMCGTAFNALRVTRTGRLSNWKGLAYPHLAACCVNAVFLAKHGITGPLEVIEGEKGFEAAVAGEFRIDWAREDLERVRDAVIKRHNAEMHSQTAIEAILALRRDHRLYACEVERIDVSAFAVAYQIIGGGEEGDKTLVSTKEEADHSLPYLVAVALLDGEVSPAQFDPQRIRRADVQELLRRVVVHPSAAYSARFPSAIPCRVVVTLRDGRVFAQELDTYPGFRSQPLSFEDELRKVERLTSTNASPAIVREIADVVASLEEAEIEDLARPLGRLQPPEPREGRKEEAWLSQEKDAHSDS
jgi:2-methylcitrate dehydratase